MVIIPQEYLRRVEQRIDFSQTASPCLFFDLLYNLVELRFIVDHLLIDIGNQAKHGRLEVTCPRLEIVDKLGHGIEVTQEARARRCGTIATRPLLRTHESLLLLIGAKLLKAL